MNHKSFLELSLRPNDVFGLVITFEVSNWHPLENKLVFSLLFSLFCAKIQLGDLFFLLKHRWLYKNKPTYLCDIKKFISCGSFFEKSPPRWTEWKVIYYSWECPLYTDNFIGELNFFARKKMKLFGWALKLGEITMQSNFSFLLGTLFRDEHK